MKRTLNGGTQYSRRQFLRDGAKLSTGLLAINALGAGLPIGGTGESTVAMPKIKLGDFEVSRLILGSNPFWGYWHKNPRNPQSYTQEGRKAVLDAAAAQGITAIWTPAYRNWIALWDEYKENGGKLETWIGQPDGYNGVSLEDQITACAKHGGKAVCVQGAAVDNAMGDRDFDKLKRWLALIKNYGLPAGLASHRPESILLAEKAKLPADFYHLTVGVPDAFTSQARDLSLRTVQQIEKPMLVFKVFGAGRFEPNSAFPYVMKGIRRKDGVCVGVDNPAQVAENAAFMRSLT